MVTSRLEKVTWFFQICPSALKSTVLFFWLGVPEHVYSELVTEKGLIHEAYINNISCMYVGIFSDIIRFDVIYEILFFNN